MTQKDREIQRRLRILKHAEEAGHVGRTCRYFGIGRASFYRWKVALEKYGEAGLVRKKPIPKKGKLHWCECYAHPGDEITWYPLIPGKGNGTRMQSVVKKVEVNNFGRVSYRTIDGYLVVTEELTPMKHLRCEA